MARDRENAHRPQGIAEYLFHELRYAFQDIRQKLLEEGWFSKVLTPAPIGKRDQGLAPGMAGFYGNDHRPARNGPVINAEQRPSFEEQWAPKDPAMESLDIEKDHGIDFDR